MKVVMRILMVGMLLMSGSAVALAQTDMTVYCNGLSDEDCQLLQDAAAAMQQLESVRVPAWSMNFDMDIPEEPAQFSIRGSGVFVVPPAAVALMSDLPPVNSPDYFTAVLEQMNAAWLEQLLSDMLMQLVVDEIVVVPAEDLEATSFEMIIKDDTFYMHTLSPTGADMWFGQPVEFNPADSEELDATFDELRASLAGADMSEAMEMMEGMTAIQEQMTELATQYVTTARGADQTVDDQTVAVFTTSFDLAGFLAAPELPGLIMEFLQSPAFAEMQDADTEEINETQIQFLLSTAKMVVAESSITTEQWVGVDNKFMYKVQADVNVQLDLALFGAEAGADSASFVVGYAVEMADHNGVDPASVEVPPSFQSMDAATDFFAGTPDMIEGELELDAPVSNTFDAEDDQDVYQLSLAAGDVVELTLESDETIYMELYGPDGFQVAEFDPYTDAPLSYTAEEAGAYLVVLEGYWDAAYTLTVSAAAE